MQSRYIRITSALRKYVMCAVEANATGNIPISGTCIFCLRKTAIRLARTKEHLGDILWRPGCLHSAWETFKYTDDLHETTFRR